MVVHTQNPSSPKVDSMVRSSRSSLASRLGFSKTLSLNKRGGGKSRGYLGVSVCLDYTQIPSARSDMASVMHTAPWGSVKEQKL